MYEDLEDSDSSVSFSEILISVPLSSGEEFSKSVTDCRSLMLTLILLVDSNLEPEFTESFLPSKEVSRGTTFNRNSCFLGETLVGDSSWASFVVIFLIFLSLSRS